MNYQEKIEKNEELNSLGKRYSEIVNQRPPEEASARTPEQTEILNRIVLAMQPGIQAMANELKMYGKYHFGGIINRSFPLGVDYNLRELLNIEDLVQEGNCAVIERFSHYSKSSGEIRYYDPSKGSVAIYSLFKAYSGMSWFAKSQHLGGAKEPRNNKGMAAPYMVRSLSEFKGDFDETEIERSIEASLESYDPQKIVSRNEDIKRLRGAIDDLDGKKRNIVIGHFGLNGEDEVSLKQLADEFGISSKSIFGHKKRALKFLREKLE